MLLKKAFDFIHNNGSIDNYTTDCGCFTRNRILTFSVVVSTILNLFKESVEYNLSIVLPLLNTKPVTGAAFSLARFKIHISFFKDLNRILIDFHQKAPSKLWKGFQLIAGDGSTVSLPASRQMKNYFGAYTSATEGIKSCFAQTLMLYDVYTDLVVAGRLSKMENSESTLLINALSDLPVTKAIFLLDRGFGHFHTCKRFLHQKRDFCIRISASGSLFGKAVMENPKNDFIINWEPSSREKKTCTQHTLDHMPISVRVTKVVLRTGEIEILVSSLYNSSLYSHTDIGDLYNLRWGIEEGYKKLKPKMKLEHFGSRKPEGIFQEFEAHIFMMNLVAVMGVAAQQEVEYKCNKRKLKYKYNWQNAYRFIRNKIVLLLNLSIIDDIIEELLTLIERSVVAVKEDRSFPRSPLRKKKTRLHQAYK